MDIRDYAGFEVGPIRPPSEANSLFLRLVRNCSWNKCSFCSIYKDNKFSIRNTEHVIADIDGVKKWVDFFEHAPHMTEKEKNTMRMQISRETLDTTNELYFSALSWQRTEMRSVFLQDADALVVKPANLIAILKHLRNKFPQIQKVTSYARSTTLARISDEDMHLLANAGLTRIHVGMESACDTVLRLVKKGTTKAIHIEAGIKVKSAGIQLSEYYMPGLGGKEYMEPNALDTADALSQINPDFIRIRTLAIAPGSILDQDYKCGVFSYSGDDNIVLELLLMIKSLHCIQSHIVSDHIVNLLPSVEGSLMKEHRHIVSVLQQYLSLPESQRILYRVGRRIGHMSSVNDLANPALCKAVEKVIASNDITSDNIDQVTNSLISRYI